MAVKESEGTARSVPCLRYTGVAGGQFHHPDGVCACFRGGPGPVRGPVTWPVRLPEQLTAGV